LRPTAATVVGVVAAAVVFVVVDLANGFLAAVNVGPFACELLAEALLKLPLCCCCACFLGLPRPFLMAGSEAAAAAAAATGNAVAATVAVADKSRACFLLLLLAGSSSSLESNIGAIAADTFFLRERFCRCFGDAGNGPIGVRVTLFGGTLCCVVGGTRITLVIAAGTPGNCSVSPGPGSGNTSLLPPALSLLLLPPLLLMLPLLPVSDKRDSRLIWFFDKAAPNC